MFKKRSVQYGFIFGVLILWVLQSCIRVYLEDSDLRRYVQSHPEVFMPYHRDNLKNSTFDLFTANSQFLKKPFRSDVKIYYFHNLVHPPIQKVSPTKYSFFVAMVAKCIPGANISYENPNESLSVLKRAFPDAYSINPYPWGYAFRDKSKQWYFQTLN